MHPSFLRDRPDLLSEVSYRYTALRSTMLIMVGDASADDAGQAEGGRAEETGFWQLASWTHHSLPQGQAHPVGQWANTQHLSARVA